MTARDQGNGPLLLAPILGAFLAVHGVLAAESVQSPRQDALIVDHSASPQVKLRPLPVDAVQWTAGFWAERYEQLREVTLDESWRLLADPEAGHVLDNFRIAAHPGSDEYAGTTWQDEWLYKWIEAAACVWKLHPDPAIELRIDQAVGLIAAAQQEDGYLSTMPLARQQPRFQDAQDHEIYNMGHLLTAGVIHHRMTGKESLLRVAIRAGDYLCANLGRGVEPYMAHNPSAIMGLVELHRLTGEAKYLDCAQLIVDARGSKPRRQSLWAMQPGIHGTDIIQDRVPVRQSREVVGHNVFFTYLYTGAADLRAERADDELEVALGRLWDDLVLRKMFANGGVSAHATTLSHNAPAVEAAGAPFELPNEACYNETCGQIGAFMWAYRMLVNNPDGRYADAMELEMYNGFLPCIGLDGVSWFYQAPLRRQGADHTIQSWNDMLARGKPGRNQICCPSNLLRTLAQLGAYLYSLDDEGLWVHHYGGNTLSCRLGRGEPFELEQGTDYPWDGEIRFTFREAPPRPVPLRLRVPAWAAGFTVRLNGEPIETTSVEKGYLTIRRAWKAGDLLTLALPVETVLIEADPRVEATRNQVAVMRGPVLYCVESPDLHQDLAVHDVYLSSGATFEPAAGLSSCRLPLATTLKTLSGQGLRRRQGPWTQLYRRLDSQPLEPFPLTLIPYFAWANRGPSAMSVWIPIVLENQ